MVRTTGRDELVAYMQYPGIPRRIFSRTAAPDAPPFPAAAVSALAKGGIVLEDRTAWADIQTFDPFMDEVTQCPPRPYLYGRTRRNAELFASLQLSHDIEANVHEGEQSVADWLITYKMGCFFCDVAVPWSELAAKIVEGCLCCDLEAAKVQA